VQPFRSFQSRSPLSPREAALRLLSRRPDLSRSSEEQAAALDLAGALAQRSAPIDVLAGFLGNSKATRATDLERLLAQREAENSQRDQGGQSDELSQRVLAVYKLGWDALEKGPPREAVRCLALLANRPVPRVIFTELVGVGPGGIEDALWAGFASLDGEEDRLIQAPSLRQFVGSCPEPEADFLRRPQQILHAIRRGLSTCDIEDERYDEAAEHGFELASRLFEYGLAGTIARRMTERLRRRGMAGEARDWSARLIALLDAGHEEVELLRGPSMLDRGLLELHVGRYALARDLLFEAVELFEDSANSGEEGASDFLAQSRLVLGEVLLELGDRRVAEGVLERAAEGLRDSLEDFESDTSRLNDGDRSGRRRELELALVHAQRLRAVQSLAVGQAGVALSGLREAWKKWCALEDDQQPDGASFQLALAQALRAVGRVSEQDVPLEVARVLLGGDMDRVTQPGLPVVLHDLAVLAGDRGEYGHAETLLVEAAMVAGGLVPETDPIHSQILYTRGLCLLARHEFDAADSTFMEAEAQVARVEGNSASPQLNIQAARAWVRSLQGPEQRGQAARELAKTERLMLHQRGPENTFVEHIRLLRRSLED